MKRNVYADNAATTKLDTEAFEAMMPYMIDIYGNASQAYSFSRKSKDALKDAREKIASCINANPNEIYFTSGGTESDNWALKGTMFHSQNRKQLITSTIEHHAILKSANNLEKKGYYVTYLDVTEDGTISPSLLEDSISVETQLVSIMFANNEVGTIQPIRDLAKVAHEKGALFHTDAVQAVGHIPIDVKDLDVDFLSASAHKFNGPKGVGFLYIKDGIELESYIDGGSQENFMRAGTENVAAIVGMACALQNNCGQMDNNTRHINKLSEIVINRISEKNSIDFIKNGGDNTLPGLISLSFRGFEGEIILHRLDLRGISISTGSACDSKKTNISHVLKALKLKEDVAKGTIRISLGKNNTEEDAEYIAQEIMKIVCPST